MDLRLVHFGIPQGFFHRVEGSPKQICVQLFKAGPGDGGIEICSFVERVDLYAGLGAAGQGALGTLTGRAQAPHGPLVVADILLEFAFKLGNEVVHHTIVKVFTAQVSVAGCGLDLKDAVFNGQDGDVKRSPSKIKDKYISLTANLAGKTTMSTRSMKCHKASRLNQ